MVHVPADEVDDDWDGWAPCEGDCDDTDATVYDGAPEQCDGLDNDCDATADEDFGVGQMCTGIGGCAMTIDPNTMLMVQGFFECDGLSASICSTVAASRPSGGVSRASSGRTA